MVSWIVARALSIFFLIIICLIICVARGGPNYNGLEDLNNLTLKQFKEVSGSVKNRTQHQLGVDSCAISGRGRAAETRDIGALLQEDFGM